MQAYKEQMCHFVKNKNKRIKIFLAELPNPFGYFFVVIAELADLSKDSCSPADSATSLPFMTPCDVTGVTWRSH